MIIIWGNRLTYRQLGYVADYCPMCHQATRFRFQRVGLVGHVYYISFGSGKQVGFQRTCETCKTAYTMNQSPYVRLCPELLSFEALKAETFPTLEVEWAERLQLDRAAQEHRLGPNERAFLLKEPFSLLAPKVETQYATTHFDRYTWLTLLAGLVVDCALLPLLFSFFPSSGDDTLTWVAVGIVLTSIGLVIWQIMAANRRFLNNTIVPPLAAALKRLYPTQPELIATLLEFKQLGYKIGSKLKAAAFQAYF